MYLGLLTSWYLSCRAAFRAIKKLRLARGGDLPFDMRPEELREHPCDRGNDTATANLLRRPCLADYAGQPLLTSARHPLNRVCMYALSIYLTTV